MTAFGQPDGERAVLARPVSPSWDHIRGGPEAPAVLVEYGDYECPYCAAAYPGVEAIRAELGDRLAFVYRHFPLMHVHPHAEPAAEAAEAAGEQGAFWAMHDELFTHQRALDAEHLVLYAAEVGADTDRFANELLGHVYAPRVAEHLRSGVESHVGGTPTFFVNGVQFASGYDPAALLAALELAASRPV
ncbi:MAG TPA: DsbA family protein [Mycobacteriales bacterium]